MIFSLKKRLLALIFISLSVAIFAVAIFVVPSSSSLLRFTSKPLNEVPPTITLEGEKFYIVNYGEAFKEVGYKAEDDIDGDITDLVNVSLFDEFLPGTQTITYSVEDSSGNTATAERYIVVKDAPNKLGLPEKSVFITFDDGPSLYTEQILDILARYNVKATFFVTGQKSDYFHLLKRIVDDGHTIAAHTYSHKYDVYSSSEAYFDDLNKINELIFSKTGTYSAIIRFPGGSSNLISKKYKTGIMRELAKEVSSKGYVYYDWNVDSRDTSTTNPQKIARNVISSLKSGNSVILMHDIKSANIESLPIIIDYCQKNGYTLLPLNTSVPAVHHDINN